MCRLKALLQFNPISKLVSYFAEALLAVRLLGWQTYSYEVDSRVRCLIANWPEAKSALRSFQLCFSRLTHLLLDEEVAPVVAHCGAGQVLVIGSVLFRIKLLK